MTEVRNNWEGRSINGVFPLRRFLGSSGHSSVFLTESAVEGFLNAAIKIVPATTDPQQNQMQLWQWKTAATFSHPHLIRLLDSGQCEIDGQPFLFVVMEYAEESLSQILPYRALGPDEVQELLVPTLDSLAFLHRENWVQGQLKPSNFLVVNDQLKLATDTIRPIAVSRVGPVRPSIYEPPESDDGTVSAASDIWALGVTVTEALTQYPPTWLSGRGDEPSFPTNLPPSFADTVQRCLSRDPADRPTVEELQVETRPGEPVQSAQPRPAARADSARPAGAAGPVARPEGPRADSARSQVAHPESARSAASRQKATHSPPLVPLSSVPPSPTPEQPMRAEVRPFSELAEESKRGVLVPALIALIVVGAAVWGGTRLLHGPTKPEQTAAAVDADATNTTTDPAANGASAATAPSATERAQNRPSMATRTPPTRTNVPPAAAVNTPPMRDATPPTRASPPAAANTQAAAPPAPARSASRGQSVPADGTGSGAVHEEIPNVSTGSRSTIHGHVKVSVRVTVDSSGRVVRDTLDNPGPSKYFNRVASEAARKWRFAAAGDQGSREWLLRFEFGRDGTTVHAVGPRS